MILVINWLPLFKLFFFRCLDFIRKIFEVKPVVLCPLQQTWFAVIKVSEINNVLNREQSNTTKPRKTTGRENTKMAGSLSKQAQHLIWIWRRIRIEMCTHIQKEKLLSFVAKCLWTAEVKCSIIFCLNLTCMLHLHEKSQILPSKSSDPRIVIY